MKKLFISLLLLLICPIFVYADMGSPTIVEYSVRIKNPEGASVYDWDDGERIIVGKYQYDDVIEKVNFEQEIDGELYIWVDKGNVLFSDVEVFEAVNLSQYEKEYKLEKSKEYYVFKEGAYLYRGPSKLYGKVDGEVMIPVGTKIKTNYEEVFSYVTYNGVSGFVYSYQPTLGPYPEGSSLASIEQGNIYILKNTYLYDSPVNGNKTSKKIKKDTLLDYIYTYKLHVATAYYVKDSDSEGWVVDGIGITDDVEYYNYLLTTEIDDVEICESVNEDYTCSKVIGHIPIDTTVKVICYDLSIDHHFPIPYVEYNGIKGYITNGTELEKVIKPIVDYDEEDPEEVEELVDENIVKDEKRLFIKDLLTYVVFGSIILAITAVVTIRLINKNKEVPKKEKDIKREEEKKE